MLNSTNTRLTASFPIFFREEVDESYAAWKISHPRRGVIKITGCNTLSTCKKGSPYSITERRVLELIPVLGSQPADDLVLLCAFMFAPCGLGGSVE